MDAIILCNSAISSEEQLAKSFSLNSSDAL